jgi:hypothetical protein
MIGIVPCQAGGDTHQVMFGERERLPVSVAKKGKQTDCCGCEEKKGQDDKQQDARAKAAPKYLR